MRHCPVLIALGLAGLLLGACALTPVPVPPASVQSVIDTDTVSANDKTPVTTDSLEVSSSTGIVLSTTLTASGTVILGNTEHPHRLTIVLDYDCEYCRRFITNDLPWITDTMVKSKRIALERIFAPMTQNGEFAAKLALCSARQSKFDAADLWLATHPIPDPALLKTFVKATGLNQTALTTCLTDKNLLAAHVAKAEKLDVKRVPFFAIGSDHWLGLLSRDEFETMIQDAMK